MVAQAVAACRVSPSDTDCQQVDSNLRQRDGRLDDSRTPCCHSFVAAPTHVTLTPFFSHIFTPGWPQGEQEGLELKKQLLAQLAAAKAATKTTPDATLTGAMASEEGGAAAPGAQKQEQEQGQTPRGNAVLPIVVTAPAPGTLPPPQDEGYAPLDVHTSDSGRDGPKEQLVSAAGLPLFGAQSDVARPWPAIAGAGEGSGARRSSGADGVALPAPATLPGAAPVSQDGFGGAAAEPPRPEDGSADVLVLGPAAVYRPDAGSHVLVLEPAGMDSVSPASLEDLAELDGLENAVLNVGDGHQDAQEGEGEQGHEEEGGEEEEQEEEEEHEHEVADGAPRAAAELEGGDDGAPSPKKKGKGKGGKAKGKGKGKSGKGKVGAGGRVSSPGKERLSPGPGRDVSPGRGSPGKGGAMGTGRGMGRGARPARKA